MFNIPASYIDIVNIN